MIGQGELDRLADRAADSLRDARDLALVGKQDDAQIPFLLLAIANQLALANGLEMVRLAREAGED